MMGRYAFSIVLGTVVTLTLLFVMQLLIVTGKQALTDPRERHKLDFVRVKKNENLNTQDFTPEKPPKPPETPPETPPQDMEISIRMRRRSMWADPRFRPIPISEARAA